MLNVIYDLTICTTLYSIIVTLISLLLRLFCVRNTKYISYLCILYYISSDKCISKEGRYVVSARRRAIIEYVFILVPGTQREPVDFFMRPTINT